MIKRFKTVSFMLLLMGLPVTAAYAETSPIETIEIVQQNGAATGTVVDAYGEPLTGASVIVKGTTKGAMVGNDGKFSIAGVKAGQVLRVTFIGYKAQEVKWEGQPLNIVLEEDNNALEEVVVTALGIKKDAKKVGYSIASVGAEELTKTGAPTFASAMYGKAAGVRIQSAPGGGTSAVSIQVRGLSSITGNTQPLIILDGVPIHNEGGGANNNNDYWGNQRIQSNGMVDINPEDIENISILKGAAASALYGSEAANGVVMITTKKGKAGSGTQVDFSANLSWDKVAYMPEIQKDFAPGYDNYVLSMNDPMCLYGLTNTRRKDLNGNPIWSTNRETYYSWGTRYSTGQKYLESQGAKFTDYTGQQREFAPIDHNQWNDIFRVGFNQTYNVSLTHAAEHSNVRFSYTYNDVTPMQYNSENNKHNFNLTGSFDVCKGVKVGYTATYMRQFIKNRPYRISRLTNNYSGMFSGITDIKYLREHTMTTAGYMNSTALINGGTDQTITPNEQWLYSPFGSTSLVSEYFWNIFGKEQYENHQRFLGSVTPSWEIIPGLTLQGRLATDLTVDKIENQNRAENAHLFSTNGTYSDYYGLTNSNYEIYYGDVMLMFDKTFNERHNVTANLGYSGRNERYFSSSVGTNQGLSQEGWFNLAASVGTPNASMGKVEILKTAAFLTASYGFDNWLYLEGTIRQEKSSTLKKGNNTFWYPSINASAVYTTLLGDNCPTWWNYGKVRASYGIVGNAPEVYRAVLAYNQGNLTNNGSYAYNYISTGIGNESIKPETKHEFELGIENKWFNNRLGMEFSFYSNTIKDQILGTTAAGSMGATSMLMNVGELSNKGIELSVNGTPVQMNGWRWDLRANLAWNHNEVKKLADGLDVLSHLTIDNGAASLESHVGEPMGDWYTYTWKTDANGNYIVNEEGLYQTDTAERHKVGNAMAKVVGGFGTSLSWKNWSLDVNFDFRVGGAMLNQPWQYMMAVGNIKDSFELGGRDLESGGLLYYCDNNDFNNAAGRHVVTLDQIGGSYERGKTMVNGNYVYDNGIIQPGVKEDGTPNDIVTTAFCAADMQLGWGTSSTQSYQNAIQNNSYVKCREIALSYSLPEAWTKKFACSRLTLSAFARNPFYIYRTLKMFDSETADATNWIYQAQVGGSSASARSYGVSVRLHF